jgi:hypothetical protein
LAPQKPFRAKNSGRQVDDGATGGAEVAEVGERPFDAVDALADGELREADEDGLGLAGGGVHLDLDRDGVDAGEGERPQLGEHFVFGVWCLVFRPAQPVASIGRF